MILGIDIGNTNIVLGCIDNGEIRSIVRLHTDLHATSAEYAIRLRQILDLYDIDPQGFEGAILSSVVPPVSAVMLAAVKKVTGVTCMVVGPGMKTGLNVRIDDPGTLAGDLLVGGVAALSCYGAPAIVMDLGTATTITVVDRDGAFRGGAILPGVKLGFRALAAGMGYENAGAYMIFGLVGVNFLIELAINIVLCPVIVRLIRIGKKEVR